tara:strand:- start:1696 stop:2832 length:1137 start_codon:yes stop_codon:yes gene_type:complete
MKNQLQVVAVLPQGLEEEGAKELLGLGAYSVKVLKRSVAFSADWSSFYRIHLQARLPFRFLREISKFSCNGPASLYQGIQNSLAWNAWIHPSISFRVDVSGSSFGLTHSHFSALQVKNAIIDLQRDKWGNRSNINLHNPDLCIHLHLNRGKAILSFDSSGNSLHRRGYKIAMGIAPLKENIASGLIRISQWNASIPLVDPLCGSGTFLMEAASIALDFPPGLNRSFLFENWLDFDQVLWNQEKDLAIRIQKSNKELPMIIGCEQNKEIANQAKMNLSAASLDKIVQLKTGHFRELKLPKKKGFLLCNPPYGKRIGKENELQALYEELGKFCKKNASGWQLWLLNGNPNLSQFLQMKCNRRIPISNGGIDCRWLNYSIH